MKHNISIIIPTLNEADNISHLLRYLADNSSEENTTEIIVVDGGSTDETLEIVNNFVSGRAQSRPQNNLSTALEETTILVITSKRGRAKQMNLGAKNASGTILYFLHADSLPPINFDKHIINEVSNNNLAGCFRMRFNHNHWWLRLASWLTQFRWRACRGGDQSQFITKQLFDNLGGFDETFIIYEDNDLINKLYKKNEFVVINKKITTSARLYERIGIWKLQYHFWTIHVKKWFGASPEELHNYYLKYIR